MVMKLSSFPKCLCRCDGCCLACLTESRRALCKKVRSIKKQKPDKKQAGGLETPSPELFSISNWGLFHFQALCLPALPGELPAFFREQILDESRMQSLCLSALECLRPRALCSQHCFRVIVQKLLLLFMLLSLILVLPLSSVGKNFGALGLGFLHLCYQFSVTHCYIQNYPEIQ